MVIKTEDYSTDKRERVPTTRITTTANHVCHRVLLLSGAEDFTCESSFFLVSFSRETAGSAGLSLNVLLFISQFLVSRLVHGLFSSLSVFAIGMRSCTISRLNTSPVLFSRFCHTLQLYFVFAYLCVCFPTFVSFSCDILLKFVCQWWSDSPGSPAVLGAILLD